MRMLLLSFSALCIGLQTTAVSAHEIPGSQSAIGLWSVTGYTDDTTGAFSHCAAVVPYKSGVSLAFSISAGGSSWRLALANPAWKLPTGEKYQLAYKIDESAPVMDTAIVAAPELIVVELSANDALFRLFRAGRMLAVGAAGETFFFNLKDSGVALDRTLTCANYYRQNPTQRSAVNPENPFVPASPAGPPAETVTEAATVLANVLGAAGVQGFRLVSDPPEPFKQYQVAFAAPGVVGGLRVQSAATVADTTTAILAADQQSCKGTYASLREREEQGGVSVWSACKEPNGTGIGIVYNLIPRPAGGVYIFFTAQPPGQVAAGSEPDNTVATTSKGLFEASLRTIAR